MTNKCEAVVPDGLANGYFGVVCNRHDDDRAMHVAWDDTVDDDNLDITGFLVEWPEATHTNRKGTTSDTTD